MNARMLIVAVSTAMFISTAAFAASMTSAQQCTALENQFDQEIVKHAAASKAAAALALRKDGGELCRNGNKDKGIKKLKQALTYIGVKPAS
jgi:hypothetical protein